MRGPLELTVERLNYSACGFRVGDRLVIDGDEVMMPEGGSFCFYALGAILPVIDARLAGGDGAEWLATEPLLQCPDPPEGVLFRLRELS